MIRSLLILLIALGLNWAGFSVANETLPNKSAKKLKVANKQTDAFAVQQQQSQIPLRMEQDCPAPDRVDTAQGMSWNTVELGLSLPLGLRQTEVKPYTRYTCSQPKPR